nr:hypothetical protein [Pseudomonas sp. BIGb0427]
MSSNCNEPLAPAPEDLAASRAAIDVMIWGGVQNGNVSWLTNNAEGLAQLLIDTRDAIDSGALNHQLLLDPELRFNAGMTKVYSLICKQLVIYDSRVAAALGWAVVKFCKQVEPELTQVPPELAFPGRRPGRTRASANSAIRPRATCSSRRCRAERCTRSGTSAPARYSRRCSPMTMQKHSGFNLDDGTGSSPLRRLEAALFMIGYDLGGGTVTNSQPKATSQSAMIAPTVGWTEGWTPKQRKAFLYRLTDQGFETLGKSITRYPLQVINDTLNYLWQQFGRGQFPLANSADGVPAGTSEEGIGTAYYQAINRQQRVPESSRLAAILEDLGVIQLVSRGKKTLGVEPGVAGRY